MDLFVEAGEPCSSNAQIDRSSFIVFSASGTQYTPTQMGLHFSGCGTRLVRLLTEGYYLCTFESAEKAIDGIKKVVTAENPIDAVTLGWAATRNNFFVRYLIADDLQQPIFDISATEIKDSITTIAKPPMRTVVASAAPSKDVSNTKKKGASDSKTTAQIQKWSTLKGGQSSN